jgi:hypothetical protein
MDVVVPPPAVAVKVTAVPEHTTLAAAVAVGNGFTVIAAAADVASQPLAVVIFTV